MKHYEIIDHTADIAIKAYGETLEDAFGMMADAMFDIITDKSPINSSQTIEFEVEADDMESLLVRFLSKLIVIHETDRLVLKDFKVIFPTIGHLHAIGHGEPFDTEKHGGGMHIKGVSYHMLEIIDSQGKKESSVQVLFDI
jgi:SHS2 domain-containing protein